MQKNHIYLIVVAILVLVVAGWWFWGRSTTKAPTLDSTSASGPGAGPDTTSAIQKDLQATAPTSSINSQFQSIDQELNKL